MSGIRNTKRTRLASLEVAERASFLQAPQLPGYTIAQLPSAAAHPRCLVYVSNGAAGAPVVAFSDGANWLRCDTLAAVSAV